MAIKKDQIARGVRVKFNENFEPKCMGDEYLVQEPVIVVSEGHTYNDAIGEYVMIKGGLNSGYAYLNQLDLETVYNASEVADIIRGVNGDAKKVIDEILGDNIDEDYIPLEKYEKAKKIVEKLNEEGCVLQWEGAYGLIYRIIASQL